jgi:Spx/MgsR family transcriptional regulator
LPTATWLEFSDISRSSDTVTTLYGISNCDTVKKARKWLEAADIAYTFHDFRVDGLEQEQVAAWLDELGWETLINQRSTSWRQLDAEVRDGMTAETALPAILTAPTLIKRPLLDTDGKRYVGFSTKVYEGVFG